MSGTTIALLIGAGVAVAGTALLVWALCAIAADADRRAELTEELEARGYVIAPEEER